MSAILTYGTSTTLNNPNNLKIDSCIESNQFLFHKDHKIFPLKTNLLKRK